MARDIDDSLGCGVVSTLRAMAPRVFNAGSELRGNALSTRIAMSDRIASPAVRAPDFPDTLDWLHTGGRRLTLGDFRGKVLLLDFWTYG